MLRRLYIRHFALIDELDMDFMPGFSVITGETGGGKSIILGAIGLLLGQRADSKTLKQGADKCVIEAHFDLTACQMEAFFEENDMEYEPADTIVRRELTAAGKSRAFVNDTPVALAVLRDLGERLMDIHSQHQNLLLGKHDFQLQVVDTIASDACEVEAYAKSFADYKNALKEIEELRLSMEQSRLTEDFLRFQYDELSSARLVSGEQEELEEKAETMTHAEDIKQALYQADTAMQADEKGIVGQLRTAASALKQIEGVFPRAAELGGRLDNCYIELKDIAAEVGTLLDGIDFEPSELDAVNERLDKLYGLEKKYHVGHVDDLLLILKEVEQKLAQIENGEDNMEALKKKAEALHADAKARADTLTDLRRKAAAEIERQMRARLVALGMPRVRFKVELEQVGLQPFGQDRVRFMFSANASTAMQAICDVASGGEVARVMLALKAMISGAVKLPTIVFDEIDTGVSGKIAEQMAQIMEEMGTRNRQVISITHLPQIAARGTTHYKVYKDETAEGTTSHMQMLGEAERVAEIAQMLSGENVTEAAIQNAKELLKR